MFYGILDLSWVGYLLVFLSFTQLSIAAVTLYLHRCQAHRALELHPLVSHLFRFWLWLSTGMETKAWAAIHRKHHAKCETAEDPHSPIVLGLPKVLWEGAELYRKEAKNKETLQRYGQGTPEDWIERNVYTKHSILGVWIMLAVDLLLFGVPGLTFWAFQMMWIPFFAAGVVNGVGHYWGYRNFECKDAATNITPVGIFLGGEELHNNHHAYPTSAKFSIRWWEFDMGWFYIRLLEIFGLARAKRVAPQPQIIPGKHHIDVDTLRDLITNRIQVMTAYTKDVILPLFYLEKDKISPEEKSLWSRFKFSLIREESLVEESQKQRLEIFLAKHGKLHEVYQFRKRLQAIWDKTTASQKELLDALQEWCQAAEATGIQKLQDFAAYIRAYRLRPALAQ